MTKRSKNINASLQKTSPGRGPMMVFSARFEVTPLVIGRTLDGNSIIWTVFCIDSKTACNSVSKLILMCV